MLKLIKKSQFVKDTTSDSIKTHHKTLQDKTKDPALVDTCERLWTAMDDIRNNRRRNFRYVFGDQWGDMVKGENGKMVKERTRIQKRTGGIALQNNHLFKVVNSIAGTYVKSAVKPVVFAREENADQKSAMMTNALQTNYEKNEMDEILMDAMYEVICGGFPILKEEWAAHEGADDSYTYKVPLDYFFFRTKGIDPRMWDVDIVGEVKDYTLHELNAELHGNENDFKQLEAIYAPWIDRELSDTISAAERLKDDVFRRPVVSNLCRTYHVWTQEYRPCYRMYDPLDNDEPIFRILPQDRWFIEETNQERLRQGRENGWADEEIPLIEYRDVDEAGRPQQTSEQYWHFRMLSPDGYVLQEYDSPFEHGSHPYIFTAHHYVNGDVYPFIGVIVDQQRYINRLISLHDLAVQNAAKGLKMIPTNVLGGLSPRQFAKQFVEIDGFIFFTPDPRMPNVMPQVVTTNATNIGTSDLLKMEVDWINDISSVSGALQGQTPASGTAASRYAMEIQNSTTSISSLFKRFNNFEIRLATKKMKTIHQYYQEPKNISVQHSNGYAEYATYDPKSVKDLDYTVSIKQSPEAPVARMMVNDLVRELWQTGAISAKQMLRYGYFEGAEQIIQDMEAAEEQAQQQGQIPAVPEQTMQAVTQQANPDVVNQVSSILRGQA